MSQRGADFFSDGGCGGPVQVVDFDVFDDWTFSIVPDAPKVRKLHNCRRLRRRRCVQKINATPSVPSPDTVRPTLAFCSHSGQHPCILLTPTP